jgi:glycosyltransferase involved in cell wall biosynthesis
MYVIMKPLLSIIVPVYNGAKTISSCIQHLENLDYPNEKCEIIIVDNNSDDDTRDIVQTYDVEYLFEKKKGPGAARNLGARKARGEILGFVDSDCLVGRTWARELEKSFIDENVAAVVGLPDHTTRSTWDLLHSIDYQKYWEREQSSGKPLNKICGANCAIRKQVFLGLGGFDEDLLCFEDIELGFRIVENGYSIEYNPNLKVKHMYLDTLDTRICKMCRHGFYEYIAFRKHMNSPNIRFLMPSFNRFYFRIIAATNNRCVTRGIICVLHITVLLSLFVLRRLLKCNIRNYCLYKTVLDLSLFKGKLLAILDVNGKCGSRESHA